MNYIYLWEQQNHQLSVNRLTTLDIASSNFISSYEEHHTQMRALLALDPLISLSAKPTKALFDPITDLIKHEDNFQALMKVLDPTDSVQALDKQHFYDLSKNEEIDHEADSEGIEIDRDEEEIEPSEPTVAWTPGRSEWNIKGTKWSLERCAIQYYKFAKIDYYAAEELSNHLYNVFCVDPSNNNF